MASLLPLIKSEINQVAKFRLRIREWWAITQIVWISPLNWGELCPGAFHPRKFTG